jgi:hypothetical protein
MPVHTATIHPSSEENPMMTDDAYDAKRLLAGLENGGMSAADGGIIVDTIDPVLVYLLVKFLRAIYPASDPAATSVLERVVDLTSHSTSFVKKSHLGEKDPVSKWFESEYVFRDYRTRGPEMIDLIVDKLES